MTIDDFIPKLSSFLPVGLGLNVKDYFQQNSISLDENISENIKKTKSQSYKLGIGIELVRDIPTLLFALSGNYPGAIMSYGFMTYLCDRGIDKTIFLQ